MNPASPDQQQRLRQRRGTDRERGSPRKGRLQQRESQRAYPRRQTALECLQQRRETNQRRNVQWRQEQRQVRREQACVNLERQNAERRKDRLRVHDRETRASESGEQRDAISVEANQVA